MYISTLKAWADPGYLEGAYEVPKVGAVPTGPDYTYTAGLKPTASRIMSNVRVPVAYDDARDWSYLALTYTMDDASTFTLYAWVDDVRVNSDSDYPMTDIDFHEDLWRTWISKVQLGSGIVRRRVTSSDIPPQSYPERYRRVTAATVPEPALGVASMSGVWWVYVNYTEGTDIKVIKTACFPITTGASYCYIKSSIIAAALPALPIHDVMTGALDESMGLDPEAVLGIFVGPHPPVPMLGTGTEDSPFYILSDESASYMWGVISYGGTYSAFVMQYTEGNAYNPYYTEETTLSLTATDTTDYIMVDQTGAPVGSLPWGVAVTGVEYRVVNAITSMYTEYRFKTSLQTTIEDARTMGLVYDVQFVPLPLTSNAWSSYVYSGARQYDMDSRKLASQNALAGNVLGAAGQIGQGALIGSVVPGVGTAAGAAAGALGAVASAAGAVGQYAYETGYANDRAQELEDYKASHQTAGQILEGAMDVIFSGRRPALLTYQTDAYSQTQRAQDIALYGASVSEPRTSCQSLLTAGGPLKISNVIVTGDAPNRAKKYIKQRIEGGIRIV